MGSLMHYTITLVNGATIEFTGTKVFTRSNKDGYWEFTRSDGGWVIVKNYEFSYLISEPATQPDAQDAQPE